MKYKITGQISITACNTCMIPVDLARTSEYVEYQIEMYRTDKYPWEIGALNKYNGKFSYSVGEQVDIIGLIVSDPRYTNSPTFKNMIDDKFLQNYINNQRRQPR